MMSSTFGAPAGGTTRGGHQGVDCAAFSLITPPNAGGVGGRTRPSREIVAFGLPAVPWITPSDAAVGAEGAAGPAPAAAALALPDRNEPPSAVAIAAFAVDRNNCRRFMVTSPVCSGHHACRTQRTPTSPVVVSIACGWRAGGRSRWAVVRRAETRAAIPHL